MTTNWVGCWVWSTSVVHQLHGLIYVLVTLRNLLGFDGVYTLSVYRDSHISLFVMYFRRSTLTCCVQPPTAVTQLIA